MNDKKEMMGKDEHEKVKRDRRKMGGWQKKGLAPPPPKTKQKQKTKKKRKKTE